MSVRPADYLGAASRRNGKVDSLTPREQEVLQLIVRGMTNQQIAHELDISESIVEKHIRALLDKLGVDSRVGAAVQAVRDGLI